MLWLVVLGSTLFLPILLVSLMLLFATQLYFTQGVTGPTIATLGFAAVFFISFVLASAYLHALIISAAKKAHNKRFGLLDAFREARGVYWRVLAINCVVAVPAAIFFTVALFVELVAAYSLLVAMGLWLAVAPFVFLRAPLSFKKGFFASLRVSARKAFRAAEIKKWASIKALALVATAAFIALSYSTLIQEPLLVQLLVILAYFLFLLASVLSPGLAILNVFLFEFSGSEAIAWLGVGLLVPLNVFFVLLAWLVITSD